MTASPNTHRAAHPGLGILADLDSSGGQPEDLTDPQLKSLRSLFEDESGQGLYYFAYIIAGCRDLYPPLHFEICQFLSMWGKTHVQPPTGKPQWITRPPTDGEQVLSSFRRLHLVIPRDCFKTTLATRANALWIALRDPTATIAIFNESEDKAKQWVGAIKLTIERSKLIHLLWPEVLPPGMHFKERERGQTIPRAWKWGDTGLLLNRDTGITSELTIKGFGIGSATTGLHFSHMIKDDIIGESSATSPAIMNDALHWVDHARDLEKPSQNGCELVNYTRWAYFDVYTHMLRKWPNDYQVYRRSQLERVEPDGTRHPDGIQGESIFPDRMTTTQARALFANPDTHFEFCSQRMNAPLAGRDMAFSPSWLHEFDIRGLDNPVGDPRLTIPPEHFNPDAVHAEVVGEQAPSMLTLSQLTRAVLIDPAPSKPNERNAEPRARNGLVVKGWDAWGRVFHLEAVPLREDPVSVLHEVVRLCKRWRCRTVGVEEVNFSSIYAPLWSEILRTQFPGVDIDFAPLLTKGEHKDDRIKRLVGPHREGLCFYYRPLTEYLIQEMLEYPHGETRDLIDASAYDYQVLSRPHTHEEYQRARRYQYDVSRERSPLTGY